MLGSRKWELYALHRESKVGVIHSTVESKVGAIHSTEEVESGTIHSTVIVTAVHCLMNSKRMAQVPIRTLFSDF